MRTGVGIAVGIVAGMAWVAPQVMAQDQQQAQPSAAKVYLVLPAARVDIEFRPFLEYSPAVHANAGGRKALEASVAEAVRAPAEDLTAELRQGILESLGDQATLADLPVNIPAGDKNPGKTLAELPFMQRRNAPVTVAINDISLVSDYSGTLVNPYPRVTEKTGLFDGFSSIGRGLADLSKKKPLTFDGVVRLSYQAQYKIYATSTGELLREGKIGPLTAESQPWQGSWTFPPNESFFDTTCNAGGICTSTYSPEKVAKLVTDPRPAVLTETIAKIKPQVGEAVMKSFNDWPDLIAAGQELAARR